jgi:hypothetical protein
MAKATEAQLQAMTALVARWQKANNDDMDARGMGLVNHDVTDYTVGGKFYHLTIGSSSAFLVDIERGIIYGNKGWLKVDYKKIIGNAYDPTFNAIALVRDRFRYGHFENAQDGSLRQPIVRR